MAREIVYSPQALRDLISIEEWIAQDRPRAASDVQPDYPPSLEREGIEGYAKVRIKIGTNGRVLDIVDAGSSEPAFFEATRRRALSRWRFRPETRDGVAVESWQVVTVRFTIRRDA